MPRLLDRSHPNKAVISSALDSMHADSAIVQGCAAAVTRMIPKELQKALAAGEDTPEGARRLTKKEEKSILHPLLRLRQACCHPQVRPASPFAQAPVHLLLPSLSGPNWPGRRCSCPNTHTYIYMIYVLSRGQWEGLHGVHALSAAPHNRGFDSAQLPELLQYGVLRCVLASW